MPHTDPHGPPATGLLYLVPTPIGNLEDITLRAIRILREADRILAEDTRRTTILCRHHQITTNLQSIHEHNLFRHLEGLVAELRGGLRLALVSDAGTPVISDPGLALVQAAARAGVRVESLPGPSAVTTALAAAGLPADRFVFEGFLPRKGRERLLRFTQWLTEERTVVFYESPLRLAATLAELAARCGDQRQVVVARELSKIHETYYRDGAGVLARHFAINCPRGEVVVLLAGALPRSGDHPSQAGRTLLADRLAAGCSVRDAVDAAMAESGLPRSLLYPLALELQRRPQSDNQDPPP